MMSLSDPILFAAHASGMSDGELYDVFCQIKMEEAPNDFQQAVLDEARMRGMLTSSEHRAIGGQI